MNNKPSQKEQNNNLETIRHSLAHVMAQSVGRIYKNVKQGVGPAIDNGFYQDFDIGTTITPEDLPKIEKEMKKIVSEDLKFEKELLSKDDALKLYENDPYKTELINEMSDEEISVYKSGEYTDLCKGPHVKSTGELKNYAYKLNKLAGAYFRGDEKNKMMQRVYGVAFENAKELRKHLANLEEAKKRDHRKLGKELDLFSFHPDAPGDVFWHNRGYTIFKELIAYWRKIHERENYEEIRTPEIMTKKIWEQSGHTENFIDKMYRVITPDEKKWNMLVKPMNCDGGMLVYKNSSRSYRDLPLKIGELGVVHRYESSGELHGIIRPREFTQDDAHLYCTPDQVKDELKKVMDLCFEVYKTFDLELDHLELSTRPDESIGSDEIWEKAEKTMPEVLKEKDVPHQINEGDGAFYGPKFDFHLKDSVGRTWQCSTIQLDFAQPENFDLEYTDEDGSKKRPVMIHRVLYGSIERFLGIIIEHYAGKFPLWLSPVQVKIIPVSDKFAKDVKKIEEKFREENIRCEIDNRTESVGKKIAENIKEKNPYAVVIGEKEIKSGKLAVRTRGEKKIEEIEINKFIEKLVKEIKEKK